MLAPPAFATSQDFVASLGDIAFWRPYVEEALGRHDLRGGGREPAAGFNATYPTFVCGDVVVKLFGRFRSWREGHASDQLGSTDRGQGCILVDVHSAPPGNG